MQNFVTIRCWDSNSRPLDYPTQAAIKATHVSMDLALLLVTTVPIIIPITTVPIINQV